MKSIHKIISTILFGCIFFVSIAQGKEQDNENANPLEAGTRALQFKVTENFNLASFSGSVISYKKQLSEDRARRIGLSLNNGYSWRDYPDDEMDRKNTDLNLNIAIDYTWMNYVNPESTIKFFYGYGPGASLGYRSSKSEVGDLKQDTQRLAIGIEGIGYAGVEWFFHSSMSLHTEYSFSILLQQRRDKNTSVDNDEEEVVDRFRQTSIGMGGQGVRFGLSVYF